MKNRRKSLAKPTQALLRIALPCITLSEITLLLSYLIDRSNNQALANLTYPYMLEYIVASLTILIGGALLVEASCRDFF